MAALSDYLENALLDHALGGATYTPATTFYLALFTTPTTDAGGGTEVVGGSYARQVVTFGPAASGVKSNSGIITFNNMPAVTVTHVAITNALTGGQFLFHGQLQNSRTLAAADSVSFAVGQLVASLA